MTNAPNLPKTLRLSRRATIVAMASGVSSLLGCGGGTSVAGLSSGGTGSFTTGTVKGLGSIIVSGVRYDTRSAQVLRTDNGPVGPLRPGMVVSIDASAIAAAASAGALPRADAIRISYSSEWTGKVESVNLAGRSIVLLGQTIEIPASAVFDGIATDLAAVTTQHFIEVHGYLNFATARLIATRIEVSAAAPATFTLSGVVSRLDTANRTFRLGSLLISYEIGTALPAGFSDGLQVRVSLDPAPAAGSLRALAIQPRQSVLAQLQVLDRDRSEVQGVISSLDGAGRLTINGDIEVDASRAAITGTAAIGAPVEAHGAVVAGVMVADRLEIKTEAQLELNEFDFVGTVGSLDTVARSFQLQALGFIYTLSTVIDVPEWGSASMPAVRVKAALEAGIWVATEIVQDT